MKKYFLFITIFLVFSCSSKKDEPIIVPPNFAEIPDPNKPEKIPQKELKKQQEKDIAKLKELLLQSD